MTEPALSGFCRPQFEPVRDALLENLRSGAELGVSLAVDIAGEVALDLYGGFCDEGGSVPWTERTITNVWSTTKTVTNLAALILADRGELDLHAPVARYWPEFAAAGKREVLVRQIMSHTSGVAAWESPVTVADIYDWEKSTAALAGQSPWWEPGEGSGYHALNQGHLIGEVIRRITGRSLKAFVEEEIARPLHADFQIGARQEDWDRIADVLAPGRLPFDLGHLDPEGPTVKTLTGPVAPAEAANTPEWRRADIGAANGHGNARSMVRILSAIACEGWVDQIQLLTPETIEAIFSVQAAGDDLVLALPLRWGIGFALPEPRTLPYIPEGRICFWGGWGGSMAVVDLDRRMTVAYVMNKMAPGIIGSQCSERYIREIYRAVG